VLAKTECLNQRRLTTWFVVTMRGERPAKLSSDGFVGFPTENRERRRIFAASQEVLQGPAAARFVVAGGLAAPAWPWAFVRRGLKQPLHPWQVSPSVGATPWPATKNPALSFGYRRGSGVLGLRCHHEGRSLGNETGFYNISMRSCGRSENSVCDK
jgi:hypothetical protein